MVAELSNIDFWPLRRLSDEDTWIDQPKNNYRNNEKHKERDKRYDMNLCKIDIKTADLIFTSFETFLL